MASIIHNYIKVEGYEEPFKVTYLKGLKGKYSSFRVVVNGKITPQCVDLEAHKKGCYEHILRQAIKDYLSGNVEKGDCDVKKGISIEWLRATFSPLIEKGRHKLAQIKEIDLT